MLRPDSDCPLGQGVHGQGPHSLCPVQAAQTLWSVHHMPSHSCPHLRCGGTWCTSTRWYGCSLQWAFGCNGLPFRTRVCWLGAVWHLGGVPNWLEVPGFWNAVRRSIPAEYMQCATMLPATLAGCEHRGLAPMKNVNTSFFSSCFLVCKKKKTSPFIPCSMCVGSFPFS